MGEVLIVCGVLLLMIVIAGATVTIPIIIADNTKKPIYPKLVCILYIFLIIFITSHILYRANIINGMNAPTSINLSTNKRIAKFNFIANQAGNYAIRLRINNKKIFDDVGCKFSDLDKKATEKYCAANFSGKKIYININGITRPANDLFGILFFNNNDYEAVISEFDAKLHQVFKIEITIDKAMTKILDGNPSIIIMSSGEDSASLLYKSIILYLPFILPALVMLVYMRRKLNERQ